jgi:low temperature requirement protein LtrA
MSGQTARRNGTGDLHGRRLRGAERSSDWRSPDGSGAQVRWYQEPVVIAGERRRESATKLPEPACKDGVSSPISVDGASNVRYIGARNTFRLEPPRLRTGEDPAEERHATWFELFFDLVFVAAVAELAASLEQHPTPATFARFAGMFVLIFWPWVLYTLYSNRFDTDDVIFRLAKSGAMLAIAAIAVELGHVMDGHGGAVGFAVGNVVLRGLLVALYARAVRDVAGQGRTLCKINAVGYGATTAIWIVSVFVPSPARYLLWAAATIIDLTLPPQAWATIKEHAVAISHLTERFGTFFIIVLGESVAAAIAGVAGHEFTFSSWVIAGLWLLLAVGLWWIYFDLVDTSVVGRGLLGLVYVYSHFPLLAGVSAVGVGTELAISEASHSSLSAAARWASAGGIAAFALSLAVLHLGAEWTSMRDRTFIGRIVLVAVGLSLAAEGGALPPLVFTGVLAAAVLGQLILEAFTPVAGAASVVELEPTIVR